MKKFLLAAGASILAAAAFVGVAPPASALVVGDVVAGVNGRPAKVSPPGGLAVYRASATNNGAVAIDVVLTDTSSGGTVLDVSDPGCSVAGATVTCTVAQLPPGATYAVDVILQTPFTAGSVTNTVSLSSNLDVDVAPGNNSASTTTPVVNDPGTSMSFVPGGGSLTYKTHTVYVPASSPGLFVIMNDAVVAPNTPCGDGTVCGTGLHLDFLQDDYYKAQDPNDPVRASVAFPNEDPCHGQGNAGCVGLAWRKTGSGPAERVPYCPGADANTVGNGTAVPSPCVNDITKNGDLKYRYDVLLLSNDPDLLPPVRLQ